MPPVTQEEINNTGMTTQQLSQRTAAIEPSVSANALVNPPARVNPPAPVVNTNDGSRTQGLVDNVATNLNGVIGSELESRKQANEMNALLGAQKFNGAEVRQGFEAKYNMPANLTRLQDIQTQLARANTQSAQNKLTAVTGGAGAAQAQRALSLEDRQNAIRNAGLAAEASVLQGNIETASTLINQAMSDYYADRQINNQNMIEQLEYYSGLAEGETKQLLEQESRKYQEDQSNIARAQSLVDSAVSSGYLSGGELQSVLSVKDPAAQAEQAQMIIARGIQQDIQEAKAAAMGGGLMEAPDLKNFGTNDAPVWKQWNSQTGMWEDVSGISDGVTQDESQKSLDQLSFLRDNVARILGGTDTLTGDAYDALYKASGPSGISTFLGDKFVGDTDYRRLETYVDTLRTNVLALMTDPTIRKFFGPQMSNADVRLMSSAGTSLRPDSMSPEDLKAEVQRLDDLFNRAETAVRNGFQGQAPVQGPIRPINVITAPDGTLIEITD